MEERFKLSVSCDHPMIAKAKRKGKIVNGTICLVGALFFIILGVLSNTTSNNPSLAILLVFLGLAAFAVISAIYFFATMRITDKDKARVFEYIFADDVFVVNQFDSLTNRTKNLTTCLYAAYKNKQYISQITENQDVFEFKVYTGTVNMVPQYKKYNIPKDVMQTETLDALKNFLKEKSAKNYAKKL